MDLELSTRIFISLILASFKSCYIIIVTAIVDTNVVKMLVNSLYLAMKHNYCDKQQTSDYKGKVTYFLT